jgi:hypothetical protein
MHFISHNKPWSICKDPDNRVKNSWPCVEWHSYD